MSAEFSILKQMMSEFILHIESTVKALFYHK